MKMAFNVCSKAGWNRLWVVAVVLWGLVAAGLVARDFPTKAGLRSTMENHRQRLQHEIAHPSPELSTLLSPNSKPSPMTPTEIADRKYSIQSGYQDGIDTLSARQAAMIGQGFKMWLIPSLGVYALVWILVWVIGWVVRGFRKPTA